MKPPITVACVAIWREGRVLLGHRCGKYASGVWCLPGGKADDPCETIAVAARREVREETGIDLVYVREYPFWGQYTDEDAQHFTCVYFEASGLFVPDPQVREPDKIDEWGWWRLSELPEHMLELDRIVCERQLHRYDC